MHLSHRSGPLRTGEARVVGALRCGPAHTPNWVWSQVSPNIFGTTAPPLLVMHAVREVRELFFSNMLKHVMLELWIITFFSLVKAISITLNDPLSYITSSNGVTSEDSVTSVFFIKGMRYKLCVWQEVALRVQHAVAR